MLYRDADGDGQTPAAGDCNDHNSAVYTGALDVADDFIDQDCTGEDNYDVDRDGDASPTSGGTDCDDSMSTIYPGAPEICGDNADNDCDTLFDEDCDVVAAGDDGSGCGCGAGSSAPASYAALFALGLLVGRRRR